MDVGMLSAAAVPLVAYFLEKTGEGFVQHYGEKLAEKCSLLVSHMRSQFEGDSYAAKTLDRVVERPANEARQVALKEVLAEKLTENPDFASNILKLVQEAQVITGSQTINISGDVRGGTTLAGSTVSNSTIVSGEDVTVVVAQKYWQGMRPTAPPEELRRATERYLHYVIDRYRYINFKGIGVADRIPLRLPLLGIYVPLRARLQLPGGDLWMQDVRVAGRPAHSSSAEDAAWQGADRSGATALTRPQAGLGEPQPVLEMLKEHTGLVVLGDPGAGKTTLVKYLALRLAHGEGPEMGIGHRLPVALSLAAYAAELEHDDVRLDDFIADSFQRRIADLPLKQMLTESLQRGTALVLLDGLDEVRDISMRSTVVERVVDFYTYHAQAGNKFIITSRIVGYHAVRPSAAGLAECTLVDFDEAEIVAFIDSWSAVLEQQAQGNGDFGRAEAERERRNLLAAIRSNTNVARLAANPLLLTILALMQRQGVSLPERRVQLYDQYIRTMLSTWNRARSLNQRMTAPDLDDVQTMRVLAPLALWMHEVNPGAGLARREVARRKLEELYRERGVADPERATRQFLEDVREHAGLFVERGPDTYGFIHLTFEEYLAAVAIALKWQGDSAAVLAVLSERIDDEAWHEVALLTVSYLGLIQQLDSAAGAVVDGLVRDQPGRPGAAIVLAGQAVLDAWPGGVQPGSRERVLQALVPTMQNVAVSADLRRQAGLVLGRMGWQTDDLDQFVEIAAGTFPSGFDRQPATIERRYWIAKYPVTNTQWARFIDADGYEHPEFWSGSPADLCGGRLEPKYWGSPELNNPIFPVVGVNAHEAEAYCRWLTQTLERDGITTGDGVVPFPAGASARLPTELEWERAAAGAQGSVYPWGDEFDPHRANTGAYDSEGNPASGATAVATYPQGCSADGAWDMSGNVWEWTGTWWDPGPTKRAVRGGSWVSDEESAMCAACNSIAPDAALDFLGFRVVVAESAGD